MISKMMPAAKYWIGDPCYVFPNVGPKSKFWDELLQLTNYFETEAYGELEDGKIKVWASGTDHGDGTYEDSNGMYFPVGDGLIGIVTQETVEFLEQDKEFLDKFGLFIEFDEPFRVKSDQGFFFFGHITIDTCDYYVSDDNDYYPEDEE